MASSAVSAMPPMHEDVHSEANGQRKQERQGAKNMDAVVDPEVDPGKRHGHTEGEPQGSFQERPIATFVPVQISRRTIVVRHDFSTSSLARFNSSELPMTESELAVMAITPIIGCSSPRAAIGIAATL